MYWALESIMTGVITSVISACLRQSASLDSNQALIAGCRRPASQRAGTASRGLRATRPCAVRRPDIASNIAAASSTDRVSGPA